MVELRFSEYGILIQTVRGSHTSIEKIVLRFRTMDAKKLLRKSMILYFPKILTGLFGASAMATILRNSGATAYGEFVIVVSFWAFVGLMGANAIGVTMQRQLSVSEAKNPEWSLHLMKIALQMQLLVTVITAAVGALLYHTVMTYFYAENHLSDFLILGLLLYFGNNFLSFYRFSLRGVQMFKTISLMDTTESVSRNVLWIATVFMNGGVRGLLISQIIANFLAVAIASVLTLRILMKRAAKDVSQAPQRKQIFSDSISFFSISVTGYLMFTFPNLIIGKILGAEALGLFSGIVKIGETLLAPMSSIGIVFAPSVTQAQLANPEQFQNLLTKSFKVVASFLFLIGLVIANSNDIFRFFFQSAHQSERFMIYAVVIYAFAGALHSTYGVYLDFLGYGKTRSIVLAIFCVLNIVATYLVCVYGNIVLVTFTFMAIYFTMTSTLIYLFIGQYSHHFITRNWKFTSSVLAATLPALLISKFVWSPETSAAVPNLILEIAIRSAIYAIIFGIVFLPLNPGLLALVLPKKATT